MLKIIDDLHFNSDIYSLIEWKQNGINRSTLITDKQKKSDLIPFFCWKLKELYSVDLYTINWKYKDWFRDIKIEIVFVYKDKLYLVKLINNIFKLDQEALKLDRIIQKISGEYEDLNISGILLLKDQQIEEWRQIFNEMRDEWIIKNNFNLIKHSQFWNISLS